EWITYEVKESVKRIDPKAKVILFGSRARGDSKKDSDWDFLILTSQRVNEEMKRIIRETLIDTELEAEEVISTIIYSKKSWYNYRNTPLFENINSEGIEI
ncbi:MAG: nucleotidyltransferase domain-containing protein, partial [Candidatus Paceibacterota bacterium]